ncbi:ATP-binding cassette domain-containing protein [Paenibacillus thermotolerans]|uniref:ABC transporter ATP-binding protein n=1 Tax=Paenibacillus thermotolerans TaxID=3027807 RepID=UPI002367D104|nr:MULTISPECIES: ATP-binding cassette domain-containing protein [unclassified Paenibacillus]
MMIECRQVFKTFRTGGTEYKALKGIDLDIAAGEFVAIVGKSGSGKSTLLNMIAGIDRPTSGGVKVAGTELSTLGASALAQWRGRQLGVIFQFFQLLPTLNLVENVMLPMDFCRMWAPKERKSRAMELLERVGMADHAYKMPSAVSGGQQQRVAIARALANDPPIIIGDEPTGSLDSKTADAVFQLFEGLAEQGKTVVMVTHDNDLAHRVKRSVIVADGEIVDQHIVHAFPGLDVDMLTALQQRFRKVVVEPGAILLRQGDEADYAYVVTKGQAEVLVRHPAGNDIVVNRIGPGQYFGEIALVRGGVRTATIRASAGEPLEVYALDRESFGDLLLQSAPTREEMDRIIRQRLGELNSLQGEARHA